MISFALALLAVPSAPAVVLDEEWVAVRAGTIHVVEGDRTVTNGTLLVRDGVIVAVGTDIEVPSAARVVDYGPSAVIVPGLIASDSDLASGSLPERTANPGLRGTDGYDAYGNYARILSGGVTSAYVTPSRARLISGQAAIVKLAGDDPLGRTVAAPVAIDGSIAAQARGVEGYWRLPIPGTVDVGIGRPLEQLPRTTMGAIMAFEELLDGVAAGVELEPYGPTAVGQLAPLVEAKLPWRITADETHEIRALIALAKERGLKLVIEGAQGAAPLAEELAAAGIGVVFQVPFTPNRDGINRGKGPNASWPDLTVASALVEKGVRVAIDTPPGMALSDLRFAAVLARRGGMSAEAALRAITLTPAEMYGVADRIGSLAPGKDADFAVFVGEPLEFGALALATWVGGELAYEAGASGSSKAERSEIVVVRAQEIHVGDGTIIAPGEVLVVDGTIVEVGGRVARPGGAVVVDVPVLMPGIIDAMGRLGLDGRRGTPDPGFDLTLLLEPGDETDVRVAKTGITTVVLDSPGMSGDGAPLIAYRPASQDLESMVVDPLAAIRLSWPDNDRRRSGRQVLSILEKLGKYQASWTEYEEKLAQWSPAETVPTFTLPADEEAAAEGDEDAEEEEKDDDNKKKKKKNKEVDPDPLTGIWVGEAVLTEAPAHEEEHGEEHGEDDHDDGDEADGEKKDGKDGGGEEADDDDESGNDDAGRDAEADHVHAGEVTERLRLQVRLDEGGPNAEGWLRFAPLSDQLIQLSGTYDTEKGDFVLSGLSSHGRFTITGTLSDNTLEPEAAITFEGRLVGGHLDVRVRAERTSRDYPMAKRPTPVDADEVEAEDDGKPREPRRDPSMDQYLRALQGEVAVICQVERADEILACVAAFESAGIKPVLLGASEAHTVADRIEGRISGVLLSHQIEATGPTVDVSINRYARLQAAGIPVAFYSDAEEGAVDLPLMATFAVETGMSPTNALRALTFDSARMLAIDNRVGRIARGLSADLVALSAAPFDPTTKVLRVWLAGREVR
jgi:imidazolonepropionase-like amidohydrolase